MRRRGLRLILALGFAAAAAGSGFAVWTLESREAATRAEAAAYDAQAERATRALAELGSGLEAYVAAGQQTGFWAPKVTAALGAYGDAAAELARLAPPDAVALVSADDLAQLDLRARQLVDSDQPLVASDMLFTDGLEIIRGAVARVDEVRHAQRTAAAGALADVVRQERYAAGAALATALLVIALLVPAGGTKAPAEVEPAEAHFNVATLAPAADSDASLGAALDARLGDWREPAKGGKPSPAWPAPTVDLVATADLCSDLGRLGDASTLPALLARAAGLLGARGLTIWIADPTGTLYPTAAHGYSPQTLSRLGSLRAEDDNAAATAFRTSSAQTVNGGAGQAGALVVPLMGVGGSVGVMAAEMEDGRERHDDVRAVARIVAAQLATLIPAAAEERATETPAARAESG